MTSSPDPVDWEFIKDLDVWLDSYVGSQYRAEPLAQDWARTVKVIEELGEAIEALIGFTGQNPRKGFNKGYREFIDEMADVLLTTLLCMQHFEKDTDNVKGIIRTRIQYRKEAIIHHKEITIRNTWPSK